MALYKFLNQTKLFWNHVTIHDNIVVDFSLALTSRVFNLNTDGLARSFRINLSEFFFCKQLSSKLDNPSMNLKLYV